VGNSLKFGTSLETSCQISSSAGSLLTRVSNNHLIQNGVGLSICEHRGSDRSTVFYGGVSAPTLQTSTLLSPSGTVALTGNLTISGALSATNLNPFWAAGTIDASGTILASVGRTTFTVTQQTAGIYFIQFATPHPSNANLYVIQCSTVTGRTWGGFSNAGYERSTDSAFWIVLRNASSARFSSECTFTVLA
jgi:hypothetical protein